jgi:hypothetical protein
MALYSVVGANPYAFAVPFPVKLPTDRAAIEPASDLYAFVAHSSDSGNCFDVRIASDQRQCARDGGAVTAPEFILIKLPSCRTEETVECDRPIDHITLTSVEEYF